MQVSPTTHFVSVALAILYRGADLQAAWREFAMVAAIGTVCFLIAPARFRRTVTVMQT